MEKTFSNTPEAKMIKNFKNVLKNWPKLNKLAQIFPHSLKRLGAVIRLKV